MKDKTARILAIVALVFATVFSVALVITLVDYRLLGGSIGFIALGSGVFTVVIFLALKADGRGFSMTKINNEIEMQKIEQALKEKQEQEEKPEQPPNDESSKDSESAADTRQSEQ